MAVLTLLVGSVLAIVQKDLKRMLAYSSISQAGYILIGVQAGSGLGTAGALFYLLTYTFIIAGSFAVVSVIQGTGEARNDLGRHPRSGSPAPGLALVMLLFLLAQAGVPFTSGFLAKFYVIQAAVQRGQYPWPSSACSPPPSPPSSTCGSALLMYAGSDRGADGDGRRGWPPAARWRGWAAAPVTLRGRGG